MQQFMLNNVNKTVADKSRLDRMPKKKTTLVPNWFMRCSLSFVTEYVTRQGRHGSRRCFCLALSGPLLISLSHSLSTGCDNSNVAVTKDRHAAKCGVTMPLFFSSSEPTHIFAPFQAFLVKNEPRGSLVFASGQVFTDLNTYEDSWTHKIMVRMLGESFQGEPPQTMDPTPLSSDPGRFLPLFFLACHWKWSGHGFLLVVCRKINVAAAILRRDNWQLHWWWSKQLRALKWARDWSNQMAPSTWFFITGRDFGPVSC